MYDKFLKGNGVYYAFVECDESMLDTLIPAEAKWGLKTTGEVDENEEPIYIQKTLREFLFAHMTRVVAEGRVVILLAAKEAPDYRMVGVNEQDLEDWDGYLTAYGYASDQWMTQEEVNEQYPVEEL